MKIGDHLYSVLILLTLKFSTIDMSSLNPNLLAAKFRGTLLAVLVGDCCGYEHEWQEPTPERTCFVERCMEKLEDEDYETSIKEYTDDTAMTKVLAATFVNGYNQTILVKNFVEEYFSGYDRGYGPAIPVLFNKLKESNFVDIKKPAQEQFNGTGSYGNGGAMRISPAALYCLNTPQQLEEIVQEVTEITHTHKFGINGALLEAFAVYEALLLDPNEQDLDVAVFCEKLLKRMELVEGNSTTGVYTIKLKEMQNLLLRKDEPSIEEIISKLGNGVQAQNSVVTAIYCFLRSHKLSVMNESLNHPFRNTLQYSIQLGGDSDTIAAMACAIAGAFYGDTAISENVLNHCEGVEMMKNLANQLYAKVTQ